MTLVKAGQQFYAKSCNSLKVGQLIKVKLDLQLMTLRRYTARIILIFESRTKTAWNRLSGGQRGGQTDRRMDGQRDGQIDIQTDRWMDR